jgi:Glycosyl transferase family 2
VKVTVFIPTRNRALLLCEAVRSALSQTLAPHEIIIIDDGSQDDTASAIASFGTAVRAIRQPQGGKSKGLNNGYSLATGDAVIVLDDDDVLPPRALEQHVSALNGSPDADFSYGRFLRFRGAPPAQVPHRLHPDVQVVPTDDPRRTLIKLMEFCFLPHPSWLARRSALDEMGPYDEKAFRSQDFEMILRLARKGDGAFVDDIVLYQRQHDDVRPGVVASGTGDVNSAWELQDRRIFARIADSWTLHDFRPFVRAPFPAHAERTAWLQKGVILFVRGCYAESLDALETYRGLLGNDAPDSVETGIASHMLLRGVDPGLLHDTAESSTVRRALRNSRWHGDLRQAFVRSARWQIRHAVNAGDYQRAINLTRFLMDSFGTLGATIALASKSRAATIIPASR